MMCGLEAAYSDFQLWSYHLQQKTKGIDCSQPFFVFVLPNLPHICNYATSMMQTTFSIFGHMEISFEFYSIF